MKTTASGLLVPTDPTDLEWSRAWTIGELIPLKRAWFRVIHINRDEPFGVALAYVGPTKGGKK